jgi:uncharacterized protein
MRPIPLQELRLLGDGKHWQVHQHLAELQSLEPVVGWVHVLYRGEDLWVKGVARTRVELHCDRCLNPYPQKLAAAAAEAIALSDGVESAALDVIDPNGSFDPSQWLFELLSLQLPLKRLCDPNCPGLLPPQPRAAVPTSSSSDPRWAALQQLKPPDDGLD